MHIVGRITQNAKLKTLADGRQVVEFSVAVNDYYKPKGSEKGVTVTTFFNCAYWVNPKRAEQLVKGSLIELNGRLSVNAYVDLKGDAKASLNLHVNSFTIYQRPKKDTAVPTPIDITEPTDDLPF